MAIYGSELVKVALIWAPKASQWPGEQAVNTFHLQHQHFTGNDFDWGRDLQTVSDGVASKLASHWSGVASMFGSGYQITTVKAFQIGTTGETISEAVTGVANNTLQGSATSILPPETAMCMSVYGYTPGTFTQHKGQKRGRIYWPYIGQGVESSDGKVANPQAWADAWAVIFNDIQGMHVGHPVPPGNSDDYMKFVVASGVGGVTTQVEAVAFDDHFDSQRRRQHQTPSVVKTSQINHN